MLKGVDDVSAVLICILR